VNLIRSNDEFKREMKEQAEETNIQDDETNDGIDPKTSPTLVAHLKLVLFMLFVSLLLFTSELMF